VAVIFGSAAAGLWAAVLAGEARTMRQRWTTWALPLLGGWLLIASAINIVTVATAEGLLSSNAATPIAIVAASAVLAVAFVAIRRGASALYAAPVVWGLIAVFAAEHMRHPTAALIALAAAVAVACFAALLAWRRGRATG
jgi:thiamine transporter ThiT